MRLKYTLTLILVCCGLVTFSHPLHLTFTNLEYKSQNNRWVLTIKVFSDDFATDVRLATGSDDYPDTKSKKSEANRMLNKWLGDRLLIWFDSKPVEIDSWVFDRIHVKDDATWITYTFSAALPGREIKIRNTILMELYSDQKNLFIVAMGQFQFAHEFKNKDRETTFKLNK